MISLSIHLFFNIHRTYYLFFKLHEIINKQLSWLMFVTIHFFNEILMIHVFFQKYKYFLKCILLFMSYFISIHMKKMLHSNF